MNCMAAWRRIVEWPARLTVSAIPPTLDHTTATPNCESPNA